MSIFFHRPVAIRRAEKKINKSEGGEEEKDKKNNKDEEIEDDEIKFKGLTEKNICKKWSALCPSLSTSTSSTSLSSTTTKEKKRLLEYMSLHADKILTSKEFLSLSESAVISLFSSDYFSTQEINILKAAQRWAKKNTIKQEKEKDIEKEKEKEEKEEQDENRTIKKNLKNIVSSIRFPLLSPAQIAEEVTECGLLETQQLMDLFSYTALVKSKEDSGSEKIKLPTLPSSLKVFGNKPRQEIQMTGTWDPKNNHKWTLSNKNKMATIGDTTYSGIAGTTKMTSGKWEIEYHVKYCTAMYFACGVLRYGAKLETICTQYLSNGPDGWTLAGNGSYGNNSNWQTATAWPNNGTDCKIKCIVDMDKKDITFHVNGTYWCKLTGLPEAVCPVVDNNSKSACVILNYVKKIKS
eukprot:TRINITY_DN619_c1_g1_i2.p1 TRINITY_DN619_c1_g1~~TRINITY_DN619_c1_g1_i2.p1  ORF type:complete len:429 (-),score=102.94 TRINITY_DN619_c1_g1_i2:161-1384(-)